MRIFRAVIILAWLALVGVLLRERLGDDGIGAPSTVAVSSTASRSVEESWMGVYMQERKIGYTHHRRVPVENGYRFEEQSVLRLTVLDTEQTIRTRIEALTTADHALRSFDVSLQSDVGDFSARGKVEGGAVQLEIEAAGEVTRTSLKLEEPLYLPTTVRSWLSGSGLEAGREGTFQVFDPTAMQNQPLRARVEGKAPLTVAGREIEAWRVRESFRGVETVVWYDDEGQVLREEGPIGLVAVAESPSDAISTGWKEGEAFDLMAAVAIPVRTEIRAPRGLDHLVLRIGGTGELSVPTDDRQSRRGEVLEIRRERLDDSQTFELPYRGEQWREDLAATPFLQAEHPIVRSAASAVLGNERDARRAAERLRRWVFEELDKRPVASIPNAVQVLDMRAGDCNEHAVLYAALARAVGLPARVAAGAVYAEGVFLYHAWNEVWLGRSWVSVDAAFDQMPADATHIKLVEGGPELHANLLPVIGRLSIEILPQGADAAPEAGEADPNPSRSG